MSKQHEERITCPNCSAEGSFEVWDSVNVQLSPDAAEALIDGSLFVYKCPNCGERNQVFYSCLYHDMERKAMVQLVGDNEKSIEKAFETYDKLMGERMIRETSYDSGYRHRLVTDINSLREKACILRDGLDDRALELMKLIVVSQNAGSGQIPKGATAYFMRIDDDSSLLLEFVAPDAVVSANVPREMYDAVAALVRDNEPEDRGLRIVDARWAFEFFADIGTK